MEDEVLKHDLNNSNQLFKLHQSFRFQIGTNHKIGQNYDKSQNLNKLHQQVQSKWLTYLMAVINRGI
jgi:hypothetical protein